MLRCVAQSDMSYSYLNAAMGVDFGRARGRVVAGWGPATSGRIPRKQALAPK